MTLPTLSGKLQLQLLVLLFGRVSTFMTIPKSGFRIRNNARLPLSKMIIYVKRKICVQLNRLAENQRAEHALQEESRQRELDRQAEAYQRNLDRINALRIVNADESSSSFLSCVPEITSQSMNDVD